MLLVHESGSPQSTPRDMHNQGIPQPQRVRLMHPLQRTIQHVSHYRVHKKDIDTIPLCKGYKLSVVNDLYFVHSVFIKSSTIIDIGDNCEFFCIFCQF